MQSVFMRKLALPWLLSLTLLSGCGSMVVNPVTGQSEMSVMDEPTEIAEGAKAHQEVMKEYTEYKNPAVQKYVNDLGQQLASLSHRNQLKWHFTVLDSPEINAFALPGGYVYVTRGIMTYMESEADLAGVMGHEIGHVTARHGAQRATKQQTAGLGVLLGSVLGAVLESQGVAGAGQLASQASQSVAAGYIASYGRDQELQADGLGAEYLSRIKLNPRNMINVIGVLKNQELFAADQAKAEGRPAPSGGGWLSSHPSNDQRLQTITQLAAQYKGTYSAGEGRERYLKVLQGLTFGDSADQGLVRGNSFYHAGLGFVVTAPKGWRIQNDTDSLALVNEAGDAALIVNVVPASAGKTHADIIRNVIKPTQGQTQATRINGMAATRFSGARQNANGQSANINATVLSGPQDVNYLMVTRAKDAQAAQRASAQLAQAEGSFRAFTAQDRNAARPWVLKTVPYPRGGFAELAKNSPIASPEKQLRLINGYYSGGEPKVGQLVKVVDQQ